MPEGQTKQDTSGSMTSHPHLLSSPCLLPGTIFGYLSALVPAKPQSPKPSFLHSQLLKAGSKAGTASFQVGFHGQGLWLEHSLQSKRSRQKGTSWDSPCRMFLCPFCCQHACQGGTLPASLLLAPCCCQPSQSYCHRAPTPCCIFTHSCMEVSVMCLHCTFCGQSVLCLENKKTLWAPLGGFIQNWRWWRRTMPYHSCTANIPVPVPTCTTCLWMPEIRSCPLREIWSLPICTDWFRLNLWGGYPL